MNRSFEVFDAGAWEDLGQFCYAPKPDFSIQGKLFLGEKLGLRGAEVSMNRMPPGAAVPFFHRHRANEELYIFVHGQGEMQIDDERFPVRQGTTVRVSASAPRTWRNTGDGDLHFVCIQYPQGASCEREGADGEVLNQAVPW